MKFRTELNVPRFSSSISYDDKLLFMGSCFAEEMAAKFSRYRFQTALNSHGILFHPLPLARALEHLMNARSIHEESMVFDQGKWHSFDVHGRFSSPNRELLQQQIERQIIEYQHFLQQAGWLVITWGTAHGYLHQGYQQVVSNCHKIAQSNFRKVLTTHDEIERVYAELFGKLHKLFPHLKVLLTVSPVKYLKDGFSGNQLSKAHLQIAAHHLCEQFPWVSYFPAFELVTDDLRDYRFFKSDLVHPNDLAIGYVWDKLVSSAIDEPSAMVMKQLEPLLLQLEHRPLHQAMSEQELKAKKEAIEKLVASVSGKK